MRKEFAAPAVALAGGVIGFVLRLWELHTGFEPDTGLPIPGAPATWALIGLSAAVAVVLLLLARGTRIPNLSTYDQAFSARNCAPYMTCMVLSAFALLGVAALIVLNTPLPLLHGFSILQTLLGLSAPQPYAFNILRLVLAVLCLVTALCVLSIGKNNYRTEGRGQRAFALLMPAYTFCVWLISAYQQEAGNPIHLDYIFGLLAIICGLLGLYFTAGFSFTRPKPTQTIVFSLLGAYFSIVALADRPDLASALLLCFAVLMPLTSVCVLLRNASAPEAASLNEESDREELSDEP